MQEVFHTSTTDSIPGEAIQKNLGVISAFNEAVYSPDTLHRQAEDTLRELTRKARELGATGLVAVRFLPTQNFYGVRCMYGYGTAVVTHKITWPHAADDGER
ncbi:hypothetical protein B1757_02730 [Acidithiobacillus marinus]|uniref:Heavy metal-binding domain-containing protein n=2 Tax=Acidithiobacillus marinus TaxID=187490 RepID=A0A2I1DPC9_9PROT|nr:hypothetical protein B1757_02730 [Acidithiobacillus marinus]